MMISNITTSLQNESENASSITVPLQTENQLENISVQRETDQELLSRLSDLEDSLDSRSARIEIGILAIENMLKNVQRLHNQI